MYIYNNPGLLDMPMQSLIYRLGLLADLRAISTVHIQTIDGKTVNQINLTLLEKLICCEHKPYRQDQSVM